MHKMVRLMADTKSKPGPTQLFTEDSGLAWSKHFTQQT